MDRTCATCKNNLGGGYNNCRINLEAECAAGAYEAWEPKEPVPAVVMGRGDRIDCAWWYACGACHHEIEMGDKVCVMCGREIKWDE